MSTEAWGNLNLCDILGACIEISVHTTLAKYTKAQCPLVADQAHLSRGAYSEKGIIGAGQFE